MELRGRKFRKIIRRSEVIYGTISPQIRKVQIGTTENRNSGMFFARRSVSIKKNLTFKTRSHVARRTTEMAYLDHQTRVSVHVP